MCIWDFYKLMDDATLYTANLSQNLFIRSRFVSLYLHPSFDLIVIGG